MSAPSPKKKKDPCPDFLLEIGVEELPADFQDEGEKQLAEEGAKRLRESCRLEFRALRTFSTPRRLVLAVSGLSAGPDVTEEILGPSVEQAFDADGKPTPVLLGFAKSRGVSPDEVIRKETPRGPRVAVLVRRPKQSLAVFCEQLIQHLSFPKMMCWIGEGGRGIDFPRPLRWIVALEGKKIVRCHVGNIASGRISYGHRFLAPKPVRIVDADLERFKKTLKSRHVWIDAKERADFIRKTLTHLGSNNHDEPLTHTVTGLLEEPFPVQGRFRKEDLELPAEVLATCMAKNQKIFVCYDKKGNAVNRFVAFINGPRKKGAAIVREYERVLEARLSDAKLFFAEDQREPLEAKAARLKQLVFLGKLGTLYDKAERVGWLGEKLAAEGAAWKNIFGKLKTASRLSKVDLVTQMVYEFPDLQGVIGRVYAQRQGVDPDVAAAIRDHYWPRSLKDRWDPAHPVGVLGAWLGIADRMDTLVGAFGIGLEFSGSQDPYALRRAAGGIVKVVYEFHRRGLGRLEFKLGPAIGLAYERFSSDMKVSASDVTSKLMQVIKERVVVELWDGKDMRAREILEGVLKTSSDNILASIERFERLLHLLQKDPQVFSKAHKVVERTHNILKGAKEPVRDAVDEGALTDGLERELFSVSRRVSDAMEKHLTSGAYDEATRSYAQGFYELIHQYFDRVLVNVEDQAIRKNRLALMKEINQLYTRQVADLSCVTQVEQFLKG